MLENRGSLATGKAGAGSAAMTDVLSGEWLVEGRESGEDVSSTESEAKVSLMLFYSVDTRFWGELLNQIFSSVMFPRHVMVPKLVPAIQ